MDNPETDLEDALTFYADDIFKAFPIMCREDQHGDVMKTSIEDLKTHEEFHIYLHKDRPFLRTY